MHLYDIHDVVKLKVDLIDINTSIGRKITLRKGETGTILMIRPQDFLIEFYGGEIEAMIFVNKEDVETTDPPIRKFSKFNDLDVIKLKVDLVEVKDEMGEVVTLRKGDVGTIVAPLSLHYFMVEFCEGLETIAIITLNENQIELHLPAAEKT